MERGKSHVFFEGMKEIKQNVTAQTYNANILEEEAGSREFNANLRYIARLPQK